MGSILGKVIEVEEPRGRLGINRSFLRVRVENQAKDPLMLGCWVNRAEGNRAWVEFKYEKLSDFCFNCGRLGHGSKFCKEAAVENQKFGPFMRAAPAKQLLSPRNHRSYSWDDGHYSQKPWNSDWTMQKTARGLVFDQARDRMCDTSKSQARELILRKEVAGKTGSRLGKPARQSVIDENIMDKEIAVDHSGTFQHVQKETYSHLEILGPPIISTLPLTHNTFDMLVMEGPSGSSHGVIAPASPEGEI
ncbi:Zinc knuckle CX2CX4HX4C [Corchorus olitorius]|uniref:Zinc knuckle CX2CX4HX4C n=1 Tax=Corchorus olitorius TaxID=93759 RepID=A0A1R3HSL8_9ROSI|nr:Zinc knuckle CX2CX4HX4C [Corchorus olitorius]